MLFADSSVMLVVSVVGQEIGLAGPIGRILARVGERGVREVLRFFGFAGECCEG